MGKLASGGARCAAYPRIYSLILIVVGLTFLRVDGPALDEQKGIDFPSTGWLGIGISLHEVGIKMLVRRQIASPPDDQRHQRVIAHGLFNPDNPRSRRFESGLGD